MSEACFKAIIFWMIPLLRIFLVIFVLYLVLNNTGINLSIIPSVASTDFIASLFGGIGYAIICYFVGWLLTAFTWGSYNSKVKNQHIKDLSERTMREMYHKIRLANPSEGFRIIKLRAEARMLEASRTGMFIVPLHETLDHMDHQVVYISLFSYILFPRIL